jgi:hypothetical protein
MQLPIAAALSTCSTRARKDSYADDEQRTSAMAELTEPAMREVLQQTMAALTRLNELWGLDDPVAPHPPATPYNLQTLTADTPFGLPPSYLQLLRIHDGIDNFYGISGDLLPSTYRLTFPDFEKDWKRPHLLFFIMDNDWNAVAFDTKTRDVAGEMQVLEIADNVDADRWPSLSDFLLAYNERMQAWLTGELADRAKVDDD